MRYFYLSGMEAVFHFDRELTVIIGDRSHVGSRNRDIYVFQFFSCLLVFYYTADSDKLIVCAILCLYRGYTASQQYHQDKSHSLFTERFHICIVLMVNNHFVLI